MSMLHRELRIAAVLSGLAVVSACGNVLEYKDPIACTEEARSAVSLSIVDSLSGKGDSLGGLWARAVDGAYRDSTANGFHHQQAGAVIMALAYERPGTYAVTVHATGYQDWSKSGVVVGHDECHVITAQLTARLVR